MKTLGEIAFDAYYSHAPFAHRPLWGKLTHNARKTWERVAQAVAEQLVDDETRVEASSDV